MIRMQKAFSVDKVGPNLNKNVKRTSGVTRPV